MPSQAKMLALMDHRDDEQFGIFLCLLAASRRLLTTEAHSRARSTEPLTMARTLAGSMG